MNNNWSKEIQSSELLYYSRFARFNDSNKNEWFDLLQIKDGLKILEIGCGPGHFLNMIKKHYPNCEVYGIDLDSNHIDYAQKMSSALGFDVNYSVNDITNLPFNDGEFDLVFSHTVVEHLPFEDFIKEQKRVLKPNGTIVFIKVEPDKKHVNTFDYLSLELSNIDNCLIFPPKQPAVGLHYKESSFFLNALEENGFVNQDVEFKEIFYYFPDKAPSQEIALEQIENMRKAEMTEAKFKLKKAINGEELSSSLLDLINQKYQKRRQMLIFEKKVLDFESTALVVYSANKI